LAIDYTFDENIFDVKYQNQFLFGDSLLVAPVISTARTAVVYLPEGDWYRLSSDKKFTGGKVINVRSPLTDLPVFVKAGGIIPMQNIVQSTNEPGDGLLMLHTWNGSEANEFVYYEDDGITYDYENGAYYKRTIRFDPQKREITLSAVDGSYLSKYSTIQLHLHGFGRGVETVREFANDRKVISISY